MMNEEIQWYVCAFVQSRGKGRKRCKDSFKDSIMVSIFILIFKILL